MNVTLLLTARLRPFSDTVCYHKLTKPSVTSGLPINQPGLLLEEEGEEIQGNRNEIGQLKGIKMEGTIAFES